MLFNHYTRLAAMAVLSFVSMYVLMYAMVNSFANVYSNINQVYMAGLMTAPMIVIELLLMGSMYGNRTANLAIVVLSILAGVVLFLLIRQQVAVSDRQFLRSMIPHHAGAILMCEKAPIQDRDIKQLCQAILQSQSAEIELMSAKLRALDK